MPKRTDGQDIVVPRQERVEPRSWADTLFSMPYRRWFHVASVTGVLFLLVIWVVALLAPTPGLTYDPYRDFSLSARATSSVAPFEWLRIWLNNILAAGAYAAAACLGVHASVRRDAGIPHRPRQLRWGTDGPLSQIMRNSPWRVLPPQPSILVMVAISVLVQGVFLGLVFGLFAHLSGYGEWRVVVAVLPHGLIELPALFLPWAAFWVRRHETPSRAWYGDIKRALLIACALLLVAALIEAFLSPEVAQAIIPIDHVRRP